MKGSNLLRLFLPALLLACLLAGCTRDPNVKKQRYLDSGKRYMAEEKYAEAAIQFQNALQVDVKYADAHRELAKAYEKLRIWDGAAAEYRRVIDLEPKNLAARAELGTLFIAGNAPDLAREQAKAILEQDPNNLSGHLLLANALSSMGDHEKAIEETRTALTIDPNRSQTYVTLATFQARLQQFTQAEESFKKALAIDPKSYAAALTLGQMYLETGRFEEALRQFNDAVADNPRDPVARKVLAQALASHGRTQEAEDALRRAKSDFLKDPVGYMLLAEYYVASNDLTKAAGEYALLLKEHPKELKVKKGYIGLLILQKNLAEASRLNSEILKANDKDADCLIYQGTILNQSGKPKEALDVLEQVAKQAPDDAALHYQMGLALDSLGQTGRAESEYRVAVRLKPNHYLAQQALAGVALRTQQGDLLADSAGQMIRLNPKSSAGYVLRAMAEFSRKQFPQAEQDLKTAISLDPSNPVPYARLGEYRAIQKKDAEAEKLLEQALQLKPDFDDATRALILLYAGIQKNVPKAMARVEAQIAKVPQDGNLYVMLGKLQMAAKQPDQAEASLQKALTLNPHNLDAAAALTNLQLARGETDKALVQYQQSIKSDPRDVRAYIGAGSIYMARGDFAKAEESFRAALKIEPDAPVASNNLAYLLLVQDKDTDYALSLAQVAHRKLPDSPGAADTLAWAYYKRGAYGLAIELLEDATKKVPGEADYHFHLGMAYDKSKNPAKAKLHLEQALQLDPKNEERNATIRKTLSEMQKGPAKGS